MARLSRLDLQVLDAMAAGFEPFLMIYQDVAWLERHEWDMEAVVASVCKLVSCNMVELCLLESEAEADGQHTVDCGTLLEHYADLDTEHREVGRPFYHSKGEFFFEMTAAGRVEWDEAESGSFV